MSVLRDLAAHPGVRSLVLAAAPAMLVLAVLLYRDVVSPLVALMLALAVVAGAVIAVRRRMAAERISMNRLKTLIAEVQGQLDTLSYKAAITDQIVASLPHPIFFLDRERRVVRANAMAKALVNTDMVGRDIADGLRAPALLLAIDKVVDGQGRQVIDLRLPVPVETEYVARIVPVDPPPGTVADDTTPVLLVDLQDVSALYRTEQMRVDFVANVSHELRTPLTSLTGFIETLQGPARDDPEARDHFLTIMQQQSDRMFRLISDLLSLSRIELDEHSRPVGEVDVVELMTRLIRMRPQTDRGSDVEITTDWPDDLPRVQGDADQLQQVFQNLLDNALKYGASGDLVKVAIRRKDERFLAVDFIDQGPGIPPEHIPRLTERFYRVDAARSRELGGTGLGLAIVKHIMNRHRGRLVITSTVGQGSTFSVTLPILPSA